MKVATAKDISILVRHRRGMFEDIGPHTAKEYRVADSDYRRWALLKMRRRLLRCYIVANNKGMVAGSGAIWLREVQPAPGRHVKLMPYLLSMFTEPAFRRKGVATLIIREAERWARGEGYSQMTLHSSKKARRLYKALGWERTREMRIRL